MNLNKKNNKTIVNFITQYFNRKYVTTKEVCSLTILNITFLVPMIQHIKKSANMNLKVSFFINTMQDLQNPLIVTENEKNFAFISLQ